MSYHLEYVEEPDTFDKAVEQDRAKVLIDNKALSRSLALRWTGWKID